MFHGFTDGDRDRREEAPVLGTTQMRRLKEKRRPQHLTISHAGDNSRKKVQNVRIESSAGQYLLLPSHDFL
jgi:hypothetical protein